MSDNNTKTLWCGNLANQVTEEILYELFLQAGPLEKVRIPKDRNGRSKKYGFITYCHDVSVPYALSLFRGTALFNRTLNIQARGRKAPMPSPITFDPPQPIENYQTRSLQQYTAMTDNLRENEFQLMSPTPTTTGNDLVLASLQGHWSSRHNPNQNELVPLTRDQHRYRDKYGDSYNTKRKDIKQHKNNHKHRKY